MHKICDFARRERKQAGLPTGLPRGFRWLLLSVILTVPTLNSRASSLVLPGPPLPRDAAVFEEIDKDRDGRLSEAEFVNYDLRRRFAAADVNKDGQLSRQEFVASIKNEVGERRAAAAWKLLNGGKEFLTIEDILRHKRAIKIVSADFQKLDQDGDGHITMTEWSKEKRPVKRSGAAK